MKKLFLLVAVALVPALFLVSCRHDDYSVGNFNIAWGTVDANANGWMAAIRRDNGSMLFVQNSRVPASSFVVGQRVIVNYSVLAATSDTPRNYNVSVNGIFRVLTKDYLLRSFIDEDLTGMRADSIGNDPIAVNDAWFGDRFINLDFSARFGNTTQHLITLVRDDVDTPDDTVRLYLHHNAFDDPQQFLERGYVAFDIASVIPAGQGSVPVKLIWTALDGTVRSDSGTFTWPRTSATATGEPGYRSEAFPDMAAPRVQ